jgi:PAS domain S-box-containing protein
MTELRFSGQAPSQVARHFLDLLDDVYRLHGMFLEEITGLRARIAELEAAKSPCLEGKGALSNVPDVLGCAVYLVSQDGTIQSWSGGAGELYGYSVEEVIGQDPEMLFPGAARSLSDAPAHSGSLRLRKDGRSFKVCLHQTVLLNKEGSPCGRMYLEIPLNRPGAGFEGGEA